MSVEHISTYTPILARLGLALDDRRITAAQLEQLIRAHLWSFECCCDGDIMRVEFENFVQRTRNQEAWLFCRTVEDYVRLRCDKSRYRVASEIISKFVLTGAEMELNIDSDTRRRCLTEYAKASFTLCPKDLFDNISTVVFSFLKADCGVRFVDSAEFRRGIQRKVAMYGVGQCLFLLDANPKGNIEPIQVPASSVADSSDLSPKDIDDTSDDTISSNEPSLDLLDAVGSSPSSRAQRQPPVAPKISASEQKRLIKKFVRAKDSCSTVDIGQYHLQRATHLFDTSLEAVFWSDRVHIEGSQVEVQLSAHPFVVTSAQQVKAWHLTRHLPYSLSEVTRVMLSCKGKTLTDDNIYQQMILRYQSNTAELRIHLMDLSQKTGLKPADFDAALRLSGPVSSEMFRLKWPVKDRRAVILSAAVRDGDRIIVIRQSVPDSQAANGIAQCEVVGGYMFEPENGGTRASEFKAINFNTYLPIKSVVQLIKQRSVNTHPRLVQVLADWRKQSVTEQQLLKDDPWYAAIHRSLEENAEALRMVQAAKDAYFSSIYSI